MCGAVSATYGENAVSAEKETEVNQADVPTLVVSSASTPNGDGEGQHEAPEKGHVAPKSRPSLLAIAALATAVLALLEAVGVFFAQSGKAGHGELQALRAEIKKRDAALGEMNQRVETLTAEIVKLNEAEAKRVEAEAKAAEKAAAEEAQRQAAAAAKEAAEKEVAAKEAAAKAVGKKPVVEPPARAGKPRAAAPEPAAERPVTAQARSSAQSCDLVGKTPEEQAAILKRCVSLMDPEPVRGRQR